MVQKGCKYEDDNSTNSKLDIENEKKGVEMLIKIVHIKKWMEFIDFIKIKSKFLLFFFTDWLKKNIKGCIVYMFLGRVVLS